MIRETYLHISCLFHTLRYLRPIQIFSRFQRNIRRTKPDLSPSPKLRSKENGWVPPARRSQSLINENKAKFLNQEKLIVGSVWNNPETEKLWLYNLHYFDDLNAENSNERRDYHSSLIHRWIWENPPGVGIGWDSYPLSLRIVNWVKWGLSGNQLSEFVVHSLAVQTRYLSKNIEYHLLGNHLFANGKALIFAGLFFTGAESDIWLRCGFEILTREIPEQILADGGHFERSPMYHAIALEDILDLINISNAFRGAVGKGYSEFVASWIGLANKMVDWLHVMQHPDGDIPLFNDAAFGVSCKPMELFEYGRRLGVNYNLLHSVNREQFGITKLDSSGYIRVNTKYCVAFLDVAPIGPDYLPGHAHADTLSFELSLFGSRVIVDTGTSCYEPGNERYRQRSTSAHNTVVINGLNSSEVWASFRVARRAYPQLLDVKRKNCDIAISCSHDGYKRLSGKPIHQRHWYFKSGSLWIIDEIIGAHKSAEVRFHLHPEVRNESVSRKRAIFVLPDDRKVAFTFSVGDVVLEQSTYHPEFGISVGNVCLALHFRERVTTKIKWT